MAEIFTDQSLELDLEVSEMTGDLAQIVRLPQNRVQELLDDYGDDKPQFPILRVESGTSNNGNQWAEGVLRDIAEQINRDEKPGYWGHIMPQERGYVFPDPETLWLGATMKPENGKSVLYVKGYNLPGSRARKHKSLARFTSWAGKASGKVVGGVRVIEKFALESIDWARPGAAGMNARIVGIATEMEGSEKDVEWSKLTLADVERENPSLFTLMRAKIEEEHAATVTEMEEKAKKADEAETVFSQLRTVLGVDASKDLIEAVTEVVTRVRGISAKEVRERVAAVLTSKLKNESARKIVLDLIPVTEMEALTDDEIKAKVDELFTSNENIKSVVTEMEQAPAPLTQRQRGNGAAQKVGASGMVRETSLKL